jgi:hypothetical protein
MSLTLAAATTRLRCIKAMARKGLSLKRRLARLPDIAQFDGERKSSGESGARPYLR